MFEEQSGIWKLQISLYVAKTGSLQQYIKYYDSG